ncbi:F-box protein At3g07870-like [Rhododendron vialii]|uniref:F-box protein At3g07870-like n=1 Tax=Rhododendron vialii TaxID=182163 RepID=UPI00265FDD1F|nr:F-box protein At3g07870-like [Rhododendron vialii]
MSQFGSLPLETVVDILSRLSITSLGRCRCVCKSWRSVIADPFLINKQLCVNRHRHSIDGDPNHYFFLAYSIVFERDCRNSAYGLEYFDYSCHSLQCSETFEERKRLQFPTDIGHFRVKSSCNGVLCLLRSHYIGSSCYSYAIILWNPSINKFKILPKPGGQFQASSHDNDVFVGIGFVPQTNDYKVVRLINLATNSDVFFSPRIEMYSLNTDSWTTWTTGYDVQWRLCGRETTDASVNGAVHWTARKTTSCDNDDGDDDGSPFLIVSFHLADEVLREIRLPKYHCAHRDPYRKYGFISVIHGKLAFTIDRGDENSLDQEVWEIWLLEDYDNEESWTKFCTITMVPRCRHIVPLQFLNNGEFVVCSGKGGLIVFNLETQQIVGKELHGSGFEVVNYTQSLVLVKEGVDGSSTEMSSFAKELKEFEDEKKEEEKRKSHFIDQSNNGKSNEASRQAQSGKSPSQDTEDSTDRAYLAIA